MFTPDYGIVSDANAAMATKIHKVNESDDIDCRHPEGVKGLELAGVLE